MKKWLKRAALPVIIAAGMSAFALGGTASADVNDGPLCGTIFPIYTSGAGFWTCNPSPANYVPSGPVGMRATHADAEYAWYATMFTHTQGNITCPLPGQGTNGANYFVWDGTTYGPTCGKAGGTYAIDWEFLNLNPNHAERAYVRK